MLGIDLYKEAILNGENSEYYGKKYKVKETGGDASIFTIANNDIVRDDMTTLFSLNLQWVRKVFFKSELEEIKNKTEMPWSECIEKWADDVEKYYIEVVYGSEKKYTYGVKNKEFLESMELGFGISSDAILKGKWYLCER